MTRNGVQDANDEFFLATSPSVANVTGQYFVSSRQHAMPPLVSDPAARRRLWDIMARQTGAEYRV